MKSAFASSVIRATHGEGFVVADVVSFVIPFRLAVPLSALMDKTFAAGLGVLNGRSPPGDDCRCLEFLGLPIHQHIFT